LAVEAIGLMASPNTARLISRALDSREAEAKAQAIEALDSLLDRRLAKGLLPLLESGSAVGGRMSPDDALREMSKDSDLWIRAFALMARCEALDTELQAMEAQVAGDPSELIRDYQVRRGAPAGSPFDLEVTMADTAQTLSIVERVLFLNQVPLFQGLPPEDLELVARTVRERIFSSGDFLCREGELGDEMFVVVEGEVEVEKGSGGTARRLRLLTHGDHIGELAILQQQPRTASVRVTTAPCRTLVLEGGQLEEILAERPSVARALLASLAQRLSTVA
jgi:hypothetical protein